MVSSRNLQVLVSLALSSWLVACGQLDSRSTTDESASEKVITADAQSATLGGYCWLEETGEVLSKSEYEDYKSFWGDHHPKHPGQNDDPKQNDDPEQSEDYPGQNDDGKHHPDKGEHKKPHHPRHPDKGEHKHPEHPVKDPLPPSKDVDSCPPVKGK